MRAHATRLLGAALRADNPTPRHIEQALFEATSGDAQQYRRWLRRLVACSADAAVRQKLCSGALPVAELVEGKHAEELQPDRIKRRRAAALAAGMVRGGTRGPGMGAGALIGSAGAGHCVRRGDGGRGAAQDWGDQDGRRRWRRRARNGPLTAGAQEWFCKEDDDDLPSDYARSSLREPRARPAVAPAPEPQQEPEPGAAASAPLVLGGIPEATAPPPPGGASLAAARLSMLAGAPDEAKAARKATLARAAEAARPRLQSVFAAGGLTRAQFKFAMREAAHTLASQWPGGAVDDAVESALRSARSAGPPSLDPR